MAKVALACLFLLIISLLIDVTSLFLWSYRAKPELLSRILLMINIINKELFNLILYRVVLQYGVAIKAETYIRF